MTTLVRGLAIAALLAAVNPERAHGASETNIRNFPTISRELGLSGFLDATAGAARKTVKIAILDNGFQGWKGELGRTLPSGTIHHPGPVATPQPEETHGTAMAQIVTAVMTDGGAKPRVPFELHLFSAFGHSNFEAAVDEVIKGKFDVVLYAQVWEYGGNGDGRGFINALATRAARSGILWVNAAGNFGRSLHRSPVLRTADDWAALPGPNNSVQIRCHKNPAGKCPLRLVLSWNDFKDDVAAGSDKDLDLILTDDTLRIVQTSGLTQKAAFPEGQPGFSKYPREILQAELSPGLYYARVKVRTKDLFSSRDVLTLTASGEFTEMLDRSEGETLLNPADNPLAITVGASDSETSSSGLAGAKPELLFPSLIEIGEREQAGQAFKGSSNAAAVVAAAAALLRAIHPDMDRERVLDALLERRMANGGQKTTPAATGGSAEASGRGLPLHVLAFGPTAPGCFEPAVDFQSPWPHLAAVLRDGGRAVRTSAGIKIFVPGDPLTGIRGLRRMQPHDMIVANPSGFSLHPRVLQGRLPHAYEIVETPLGARVCGEKPKAAASAAPRAPHEAATRSPSRRAKLPSLSQRE